MSEPYVKIEPYEYYSKWAIQYTNHNDETFQEGSDHYRYVHGTRSVYSYKNPKWKIQIRKGQCATTPFLGYEDTVYADPFSFSETLIDHPTHSIPGTYPSVYNKYGNYAPALRSTAPGSLSEVVANNVALEQFVRKVVKVQNTFQGGVFLGEVVETIKLIKDRGKLLRGGVDDLFRIFSKKAARTTRRYRSRARRHKELYKEASDLWLEYQLGWAPLIQDIDSAMQTAAESIYGDGNSQWKACRAIGVQTTPVSRYVTQPTSGSVKIYAERFQWNRVTVIYVASVDCGFYSAANPHRVGLGWSDVAPTVWELIPYSFLVDYFSNIGNMIYAASLARSSLRWVQKTVIRETVEQWLNFQNVPRSPSYYGTWYTSERLPPRRCFSRRKQVDREQYFGSLVPDLSIHLPHCATQWLNIAGLIANRRSLKNFYRHG